MRAPSTKKAAAKESLVITTKCRALCAPRAAVVAVLTAAQLAVRPLVVAAVKAAMATAKCQKASIR